MINESQDPKPVATPPGPEISFGVGIDRTANKVVFVIEVENKRLRINFSEQEVGEIVRQFVSACHELRGQPTTDRSAVVIPTRSGPIRPAPRPPLKLPGV